MWRYLKGFSDLKFFGKRTFAGIQYVENLNSFPTWLTKQESQYIKDISLPGFKYDHVGIRPDHELPKVVDDLETQRLERLQDDIDVIDLGRKNDVFNAGIYTTKDINGFLVEQLDNPSYEHLHSRLQSDLFQWYDLSLKFEQWTQSQDFQSLKPNDSDQLLQDKIDSLEIDLMFLESFVKDLTSNHMDLTFKDLFSLLLGLSLWPKKFTYDQSLGELQFQQLNQILKKTTLERMKGIYIGHKNHMPDTWRKLAICKAWIEVEKNRKSDIPYHILQLFAGGSSGNSDYTRAKGSRVFFNKFTPSTLIDFVRVSRRMKNLPKNLHSYYALYKFYELFDYFDINEIAAICDCYSKHNILAPSMHPLTINLNMKILNKMTESGEMMSNKTFHFIDRFLLDKAFPKDQNLLYTLLDKVSKNPILDTGNLLKLMSMATELKNLQQHQIYKNVETGLVRDISSINQLSSLRTLLCMISHGHFQENKDVLIENLVEHLNNLFSDENFDEINEWKYSDLTDVIMWLTYLNVYNEKLFENYLNYPKLFKKMKDGTYEPNKLITHMVYSESQSMTGAGDSYSSYNTAEIERVRFQIKIIDGLTKYRQGVNGLKLSESSRQRLYSWKSCMSPFEHSKWQEEHHGYNIGKDIIWYNIGDLILKVLSEETGIDSGNLLGHFIFETRILPCFELVDYVICLNNKNQIVPLPIEILQQDDFRTKNIPSKYKENYTFKNLLLIHPKRMTNFRKSIHDPQGCYMKIVRELGYQIHIFNIMDYSEEKFQIMECDLRTIIQKMLMKNICQ